MDQDSFERAPGEEELALTALFEAADDEFFAACPGIQADEDEGIGCIDLWIHYFPERRVIEAEFEFQEVVAWLREHGHRSLE